MAISIAAVNGQRKNVQMSKIRRQCVTNLPPTEDMDGFCPVPARNGLPAQHVPSHYLLTNMILYENEACC